MLTLSETQIATQYYLMKAGGDVPALTGICKAVIALDDEAKAGGRERVLDVAFIEQHTHGFEEFASYCRNTSWDTIEKGSGLTRAEIERAARTYAKSKACLGIYGMGVTQQMKGTLNVQMIANLLLLRGNIGKPGGNILPVRGHSNVQGQRTVGITEKPHLAPLDKLEQMYGFRAPREKGLNIIGTANAMLRGELEALICLGGNLTRAMPDGPVLEEAWRRIPLTVQIATKLNRSHVIHGKTAYILPCLGRIEIDRQANGEQAVSMENSPHISTARGGRSNLRARICCQSPGSWPGLRRPRCRRTRKCRGTSGWPITTKSATRWRRRGRKCSRTSTGACSRPAASKGQCLRGIASGRRPRAAPISLSRTILGATPWRFGMRETAYCALAPSAATISSTPRFTASPTGCAAWTARAWCCS